MLFSHVRNAILKLMCYRDISVISTIGLSSTIASEQCSSNEGSGEMHLLVSRNELTTEFA